jgi:hypothetical protein
MLAKGVSVLSGVIRLKPRVIHIVGIRGWMHPLATHVILLQLDGCYPTELPVPVANKGVNTQVACEMNAFEVMVRPKLVVVFVR